MLTISPGKRYLITGGSGFLGAALIEYILNEGGAIRVISRNEGKLIELKEKFPAIEIYPGDVSNVTEVIQAIQDINGIFHLAAFKHVGLAEKFVSENIKTNIIGSLNILEQSLHHPNIEFILGISTDKAVQVVGVYGASKFLMERLFRQFEEMNPSCQYRLVRYGNVLYSTGSVLCKWKALIPQGKEIIVTEPTATRFFWTVDEAIHLIKECMKYSTNCTPYYPNMKSIKIQDLVDAMILKYSNGKPISIKTIGLQPGENLHEKVLEEGPYSNEVEQYTIEEILQMI